ncbi:MAG TPA: fibronectin type III domain-containing protein, partial [Elusimicrobiales bacterium]|nr:fibronectin type III domain-containing protein [Elusimicrobiales bacterium]
MKINGGKLLLGSLLACSSFAFAGSFDGAANKVLPGVVNSGGQGGVASGSHNLIGDACEIGRSSFTSTNHILYSGFGSLVAWPETVPNLSASADATPGVIALAWTAPKADGSTGTAAAYEIRYSSTAAESPAMTEAQFWLSASAAGKTTVPSPGPNGASEQLNIPGLLGGTTYYFAVKARASWDAWGYLSNGATAQTRLYPPAFDSFQSVAADSIQFRWTASGNGSQGVKYRVLVSTAPDPFNPGGAVVTSSDTYNQFLSSAGLFASTTYYFAVAGVNYDGVETAYTGIQSTATLPDTTPPSAPAYASPADASWHNSAGMTFAWGGASDGLSGLSGYLFDLSTLAAQDFSVIYYSSETANLSVSTGPFAAAKHYYWRVRAKDNAGNYSVGWSTWSVEFEFTAPAPNPPGGNASADSPSQVTWTATAPSDAGGSGLSATPYSFDNGGAWQANGTFVKSDCDANTPYAKTIKYRDNAGNRTAGTEIVKYSLAAAPSEAGITCNKSTKTASGASLFTFNAVFGAGSFEYLKYKWDTAQAESDWPDTWPGWALSLNALPQGTSYYLHLKAYNYEEEANAATLTKGPYWYQNDNLSAAMDTNETGAQFGGGLVRSSVTIVGAGDPAFLELKI